MEIVKQNIACEPDTFIYLLHEEQAFDTSAFQKYYEDLQKITAVHDDMVLVLDCLKINNFVLRCIIYHFLPQDLYIIKNLPENISDYVALLDKENDRLTAMLKVALNA